MLDITPAKARLGWEPKVPLEDDLKMTIKWFKKFINRIPVTSGSD
jgi:nucleoside-diphosphate-sugar epimerase